MKLKHYKIKDRFIILKIEKVKYKIHINQLELIDSLIGQDFAPGIFGWSNAFEAFWHAKFDYPDDFEIIG